MDRDIYDRKTALKRIGNNEKLFDKYLNLSLQDIPVCLDKLKQASAVDNLKSVIIHAHSVKTMAATIGADMLRDVALELENAGKACDTEHARQLVSKVNYEFDRFRVFIAEI